MLRFLLLILLTAQSQAQILPSLLPRLWGTRQPESLGLDPQALAEHLKLCAETGADSCLVVYRGAIVSEWYSPRYARPAYMMSSTKSVSSLLLGMLLDEGKIKSLDEPVCRYIPQWCAGRRAKVTLRHLLSHTSGLRKRLGQDSVGYAADKNAHVIPLEPEDEPGAGFAYSNEGVQLLSPILDKAAGEPIQDYARRRLFAPLGMTDSELHLDVAGHAWTYADMHSTPRDFARLGQLILDGGVWNGRRIVSGEYLADALKPAQPFDPSCGLLWWLSAGEGRSLRAFMTLGYLDTNMYVFPEARLIVVRTQSKPVGEWGSEYHSKVWPVFERLVPKTP